MLPDDQCLVLRCYPCKYLNLMIDKRLSLANECIVDSIVCILFRLKLKVIDYLCVLYELILRVPGKSQELQCPCLPIVVVALYYSYSGVLRKHTSHEGSLDAKEDIVPCDDFSGDTATGQYIDGLPRISLD